MSGVAQEAGDRAPPLSVRVTGTRRGLYLRLDLAAASVAEPCEAEAVAVQQWFREEYVAPPGSRIGRAD